MSKIILTAAIAAALSAGSALAATAATKTTHDSAAKAKQADCTKQWSGQKKHIQSKKAFMASCMKPS